MEKRLQSKSSKFRHGGYAALQILAVLAIVATVNLLVDKIPWKADITRNKLYSLSETTGQVLDSLQEDITITLLAPAGTDPMLDEILKKYSLRSRRIKLQNVEPDRNPGWSKQYTRSGTALGAGTLVVATGKKFKNIDPYALYNIDIDSTGPGAQPYLVSHSIEQRVTSALLFVTAETNVTVYELRGHGETSLGAVGMAGIVGSENFDVRELHLPAVTAVPEDADILFIMAPEYDLPEADAEKIRRYLAGGGRAMFLLDLPSEPEATPILDGLIASYGLTVRHQLVIEGDTRRTASGNPLWLLPEQQKYHDILVSLTAREMDVLIPGSQAFEPLSLRKQTLKIEPLLFTTEHSWSKRNYNDLSSFMKEKRDLEGPFLLAASITDTSADPSRKATRLVVVGSSGFLAERVSTTFPGNTEFLLNSLHWLTEEKASVSIQPKSLRSKPLQIDPVQGLLFTGLVVILMPLLVLGCGLLVWMRRRHL